MDPLAISSDDAGKGGSVYLRAGAALRSHPGLGALPRGYNRKVNVVPVPFVVRKGGSLFLVKPPPGSRLGLGFTPGCGPDSLNEAMAAWQSSVLAFPTSLAGEDPTQAALEDAQTLCQESGAGAPFGCPPMAGCDPASLQALARSLGSSIASNSRYNEILNYGGGTGPNQASNQGFVPFDSSSQPAAAIPASAAITNTSRPGQSFQVGDSWQLTIKGSPGQPVSGSSTQDGRNNGTQSFGSTDSSGQLILHGTMDASTAGTWREMWTVGSSPAPLLVFTVAPVGGAAPPPSGGGSGSGAGTNAGAGAGAGSGANSGGGGGGGSQQTGGGGGGSAAAPSSSISDFLSQSFSVGSVSIPYWGAGIGLFAALFFFGGGRR